jgi:hypothetical protein
MLNEMPIHSVSKIAKHGCYANLSGFGPVGEVCSSCAFLVAEKSKFICFKYREMVSRKGSPISPASAACKYFKKPVG